MKKITQTVLILFLLSFEVGNVWGQQIPQNPNKTDKKGQKQGKWTILYDKDWNITQNREATLYYRVITYKNDQPKGIVNDFYRNGQKQWEGVLIAENPDKIEGKATWYAESGAIEMEQWHEEGIIQKAKTYYENGQVKETYHFRNGKKEGEYQEFYPDGQPKTKGYYTEDQRDSTWITYYEDGTKWLKADFVNGEQRDWVYYKEKGKVFFNQQDYQQAIPYFEKALGYYPQKDTVDNLNYTALVGAFLGKCYYNLKDYPKAIPCFIRAINSVSEAPKGQEEGFYWTVYHTGFMLMELGNKAQNPNRNAFYEKAADWYIRSIEFAKKYSLTTDEKYFYAHRNIFQLFARNLKVEATFPYALAYFKMLEKDLDKNYKDWARVGHFIAKYYYAQKELGKLENFLNTQQKIILEREGEENINNFYVLTNYATLYFKQAEAIHKTDSVLSIAEPMLEKLEISKTLKHNFMSIYVGTYLSHLKNMPKVEKYFAEYEKLSLELYGENASFYKYELRILRIMYYWYRHNYLRAKEELEYLEDFVFKKYTKNLEVLQYLLTIYNQLGNTEGIIRIYEKIEQIPEEELQVTAGFRQKTKRQYIDALIKIGDFVQAEQKLKNWISEIKDSTSLEFTQALNLQAIFYQESKQYEKAEKIYLALLEKAQDSEIQFSLMNNLGLIYFALDKFDKSLHYFQKCLQIGKQSDSNIVTLLANMAGVYERLFQFDKAIANLEKASQISLEQDILQSYIHAQNTLSVILAKSPQKEEQERALAIALKNREKMREMGGQNNTVFRTIEGNIATFYDRMGRYEEAEKIYTRLIDQRFEQYQAALGSMSEEEKNKFIQEDATLYSNYQAFVLNRALNFGELLGKTQIDKSILGHFFNYRIKTKGMLLDATSKIRKNILSSGDTVLIQQYRTWESIKAQIAQANSLSEEERRNAKIDLNKLKEKANTLEKDLSLASQNFKNTFQSKIPTWQDLQKELKAGEILIDIVSMKGSGERKKTIYSFGLNNYLEKDYAVVSKVFPGSNADKKGIKIGDKILKMNDMAAKEVNREALEKLSKKEGLNFVIENAKGEIRSISLQKDSLDVERYGTNELQSVYLALIITPETKDYPETVLLENREALDTKFFKYYKNSIKYQSEDKYSYLQYWQPIADKLKMISPSFGAGQRGKLYLSPDGVYNKINLQTLRNPETEAYVFDEIDMEILSNPKDLLQKNTAENPQKSAVLLGRPSYDMKEDEHIQKSEETRERSGTNSLKDLSSLQSIRFSDLEGTEKEVDKIAALFQKNAWNTAVFKGKEALEENVKKLQNPKILHIATHGFFIDALYSKVNPMLRSGLVLAGIHTYLSAKEKYNTEDGILTAYEASALSLDNTDLVVLSACETGLGKVQNGEGVYGLQRAFQIAGAKTILMSLWTVSDEATQKLMTYFYEVWLAGKSKREAFRIAQTKLRKEFPEPYYWGAFVMIGE